jgi:Tol biopolymer transport system component
MVMKRLYVLMLIAALIVAVVAVSGILLFSVNKPEPTENTVALSDAPYIYWYDDTADALVIERADGTDSRHFALGTLPDDYSIGDLNWSASGEWVAWLVHHDSGPGYSRGQLRISRTDGTELLNLIPEDADVRYAEWSPTDDYLFVTYQLDESATVVVTIIDVSSSAIHARMTLNGSFAWNHVPTTTYWLSDGSGVVANQTQLSDDFLLHLRTDGTSELYDRTIYLRYGYGRLIVPERVLDDEALNSEYEIVVRDLITQEERITDTAGSPYARYYTVYWNPSRTHALVWLEQCPTDNSQPCAENLKILDWEAETVISINPTLHVFQAHNELYSVSNPMWSPDGRYVILSNEKGYPSIYDTQTNAEAFYLEVENPHWAWTEDSTAILLMPTDAPVVVRFELATGEVSEQALNLPGNWFSPLVSPNGRYLLPLGMADGQLIDLETQEVMLLSHHSNGAEAGRYNDIIWYEDGLWFIASEIVAYAGGGGGPSSSTVYQLNGDIRRELGIEGATDFVPERAWRYLSAGRAESVVPEPEKQLPVGQNVWGVAWSPDGTQVVAYSSNNTSETQPQLTLWDISGDSVQLIKSYATDFNCAPYPYACQITWDNANRLILNNYEAVQSWNIAMGEILELGIRGKTPDDISPFPLYDDGVLSIIEHDMFVIEPSGEQQAFGTLSDFVYDTNSNRLITASIFSRSMLWDADTGDAATDLHILPIVARDLALSPDGTILAAASSNRVDLWAMDDLLSTIELSE